MKLKLKPATLLKKIVREKYFLSNFLIAFIFLNFRNSYWATILLAASVI